MTTQTPTNAPETATSESPDLGSLSFTEYQAARRGEKVERKQESAPVDETEQKAAAKSDPADTEVEGNEESDDEASDELDESNDSDKDKPRKKGGIAKRIGKLNARISEREREIEYWKSQAMKNGATEEPKQSPKVETAPANDGKPTAEHFETHAEYVEALTDWKLEQRDIKAKQEAEKSKLMAEQENLRKTHYERVKAFADKTDDFADVIENLSDVRSPVVEQIIMESDNGPELLYELAKNPEEAKRICSLGPIAAAREMGKLELKVASRTSEPKQELKKQTSAPKPIDPVGSTKVQVRKSITDPEISFADYERLRRDQMRRKGR